MANVAYNRYLLQFWTVVNCNYKQLEWSRTRSVKANSRSIIITIIINNVLVEGEREEGFIYRSSVSGKILWHVMYPGRKGLKVYRN